MHSLLRLKTYQNSLKANKTCIMVFLRHVEIERNHTGRCYCSKKDDIIEKLDNLEQKIQAIVRKKTIDCLETKCKQPDTSLPDCNVSEPTVDCGRRLPVHPIPQACPPKPNESDTCIRPYVNPCPPHPLKICSPCARPVDPCRETCMKPKYKMPEDKKIMELDIRMMRVLLVLTTIIAAYILYRLYTEHYGGTVPVLVHVGKKSKKHKPSKPPQEPEYSSELPSSAPYLIVGGGTAAYSAMKKLIELDPNAKIFMISKDHYYPYNKAPLNTELLLSDPAMSKELKYIPRDIKPISKRSKSIFYEDEGFYTPVLEFEKNISKEGSIVSVARGWEVLQVDSFNKTVHLDGKSIKYDKCLIATGSSPRNIDVFTENSDDVKNKVSNYTTVYDYQVLDDVIDSFKGDLTVAILGGGLNGTELACTLRKKNIKVIQIIEDNNLMDRLLPGYLSQWLTKRVANTGVTILPQSEIQDAQIWTGGEHDGSVALHINNKKSKQNYLVFADHVIVSIGNSPNTALAESSGFELDRERGCILVNTELQIRRDLYAAGDCISYYDGVYGRRHFEHYEHAIETGKTAAENIMSLGKTYNYQTLIWSDLLDDLGYEAVGTIDSSLPTVGIYYNGDAKEIINQNPDTTESNTEKESNIVLEKFDKGIVFYLNHKEIIVGILTWNVFNRASMLRTILEKTKTYKDCDDLARFLNIHN